MPSVGFLATFDGSAARSLVPTEIAASACSLKRLREVFFERTGLDAHILHTGGLELGGQNEPFIVRLELPLLPTHGDAHPMNVLTGHDTSWFDWSDLCLAHPLLDIGWFLAWLSHPGRRGLPLRGHKQDATTILWQTYLEAAGHDGSTSLSDTMLITLTHRILVYHERYAYWQGTIPDWRPQYVPFLLRSLLKLPL